MSQDSAYERSFSSGKEIIEALEGVDVIKAWKDPEYRANLTEEQRSVLPTSPAGSAELSEEELKTAAGGTTPTCAYAFTFLTSVAVSAAANC